MLHRRGINLSLQYYQVIISIELVNDSLISTFMKTIQSDHKIFHLFMEQKARQVYASLTNQRCITRMGRGFHLPHMWQYYLRDLVYVEIQEVGTGESNPVAYGGRTVRRHSPAWWGHHRSLR